MQRFFSGIRQSISNAVSGVREAAGKAVERVLDSKRLDFLPPVKDARIRQETKRELADNYRRVNDEAEVRRQEFQRQQAEAEVKRQQFEEMREAARRAERESKRVENDVRAMDDRIRRERENLDEVRREQGKAEATITKTEEARDKAEELLAEAQARKRPNAKRIAELQERVAELNKKLEEAERKQTETQARTAAGQEQLEAMRDARQELLGDTKHRAVEVAQLHERLRRLDDEAAAAERAVQAAQEALRALNPILYHPEHVAAAMNSNKTREVEEALKALQEALEASRRNSQQYAAIRREQERLRRELEELASRPAPDVKVGVSEQAPEKTGADYEREAGVILDARKLPRNAEARKEMYGPPELVVPDLLGYIDSIGGITGEMVIVRIGTDSYQVYYLPEGKAKDFGEKLA